MLNKLRQQYASSGRFWLKHLIPALIFVLLMLLVYPHTQLDTRISDLFFDGQLYQFELKKDPVLAGLMHIWLKWLMVVIASASLLLALLSCRLTSLKAYRLSLLWVFAGMVISTAVVSIFKHYSQHDCPLALTLYGGSFPLFDLFTSPPTGAEAGRCSPAGGFALMAFYFAFIYIKPRFSVLMLWVGLLMGLLMGLAQMMRGAHFLSHVLWSGWVVWMTLLTLYWLWPVGKLQKPKDQSISLALLMLRE
jgi:membrane-associated PAP2 superfamily phosphatase